MDKTLRVAKYRNRLRETRNANAWKKFSPDGTICRYCEHDHTTHLTRSGQPHFYRPATAAEWGDGSVTRYWDGDVLGYRRRMTVAQRAEFTAVYCSACAQHIGTAQVLCYQRNIAVGEMVGGEEAAGVFRDEL